MSQDRNESLNELDSELAQMAQDVPEMPAGFHARWTEQIRREAGASQREKTAPRKENRRQWRYVLSAAALFVFLIGGTLLTRNTGKRNMLDSAALSNAVLPQEEGTAVTEDGAPMLFAMNLAAEEPAEEAAEEETYAADAAAGAVLFSNAAGTAGAAATSMPTQMPALQAKRAESGAADAVTEEAEEPADAGVPEEQEETAESEFVSFLKDLGIFTLKTLAVLLCGGALAFLAAAARRKMKKGKQ